jgi:hypothetical protein
MTTDSANKHPTVNKIRNLFMPAQRPKMMLPILSNNRYRPLAVTINPLNIQSDTLTNDSRDNAMPTESQISTNEALSDTTLDETYEENDNEEGEDCKDSEEGEKLRDACIESVMQYLPLTNSKT